MSATSQKVAQRATTVAKGALSAILALALGMPVQGIAWAVDDFDEPTKVDAQEQPSSSESDNSIKRVKETLPLENYLQSQNNEASSEDASSDDAANDSDTEASSSQDPKDSTPADSTILNEDKPLDTGAKSDENDPSASEVQSITTTVPLKQAADANAGAVLANDGLSYVVNDDGATVTLTGIASSASNNILNGALTIPEQLTFGDSSYTVTAIGPSAEVEALANTVLADDASSAARATAFAEAVAITATASAVTSIELPATITSIDPCVFAAFPKAESITFASANEHYSAVDGALFALEKVSPVISCPKTLLYVPEAKAGVLTLPEQTQGIAPAALARAFKLSAVATDSREPLHSSYGALYSGLTLIAVPAGMSGTLVIEDGATSVAEGALWGANLAAIKSPASVAEVAVEVAADGKTISIAAAEETTAIVSIPAGADQARTAWEAAGFTVEEESLVAKPGDKTELDGVSYEVQQDMTLAASLATGADLERISIPQTVDINGTTLTVTQLATGAFANSSLRWIELPSTIDVIGVGAFENCTALTTAWLGNGLKDIRARAFAGATSLVSLVLPKGFNHVGSQAFEGTSATIMSPARALSIETSALENSSSVVFCPASAQDAWNAAAQTSAGASVRPYSVSSAGSTSLAKGETINAADELSLSVPDGARAEWSYGAAVQIDTQTGEITAMKCGRAHVSATIVVDVPYIGALPTAEGTSDDRAARTLGDTTKVLPVEADAGDLDAVVVVPVKETAIEPVGSDENGDITEEAVENESDPKTSSASFESTNTTDEGVSLITGSANFSATSANGIAPLELDETEESVNGFSYTGGRCTFVTSFAPVFWWMGVYFDGNITWTGGTQFGPETGSLVTVNVTNWPRNYHNGDMKDIEAMQYKSVANWKADATKRIYGLRNTETGSYLSFEEMFSGNPFSFSYIMHEPNASYNYVNESGANWYNQNAESSWNSASPEVKADKSQWDPGWITTTFEPVYTPVEGQVLTRFEQGFGTPPSIDPIYNSMLCAASRMTYTPYGSTPVQPLEEPMHYDPNYVFGGWYTEEQGKGQLASTVTVTEATTFYAKWVPKSEGGTGGSFEFTNLQAHIGVRGQNATFLATYGGLTGKVSWTGGTESAPVEGSIVTMEITDYANKYLKLKNIEGLYGRVFDEWGASKDKKLVGIRDTVTGSYIDVNEIYSGNTFRFSFSYTGVAGTIGRSFSNQRIDFLGNSNGSDVNLEPVYETTDEIPIKFVHNGYSDSQDDDAHPFNVPKIMYTWSEPGGAINVPSSPGADGKVFCGWYNQATGEAASNVTAVSDLVFEAKFADQTRNLTIANGSAYMFTGLGTEGYWLASNGGIDASVTWSGGTADAPGDGSVIAIRVTRYENRYPENKEIEGLRYKAYAYWNATRDAATHTAQKLIGFRNAETGCYVSIEDMYSGNPFELVFNWKPGCTISSTEIRWNKSTQPFFVPVYEELKDVAPAIFYHNTGIDHGWDDATTSNSMLTFTKIGDGNNYVEIPKRIPVKPGYLFEGWCTNDTRDAEGSIIVTETRAGDGNATDKWLGSGVNKYWGAWAQPNNRVYEINYSANGGSGSISHTIATMNEPTTLAPNNGITKTGYHFDYWNTQSDGNGESFACGSTINKTLATGGSKITLYAKWEASSYNITFNMNNGSGAASSGRATYDAAMPDVAFTTMPSRKGYTFDGFYDTDAATGGTQYYTATISGNTVTVDSARTWNKATDTTLYARWIPNVYKVTLDGNGGSDQAFWQKYGIGNYKEEACETLISSVTAPVRAGYVFEGYFESASDNGATVVIPKEGTPLPVSTSYSAPKTLYAHWSPANITMTWQSNGATIATTTQVYDPDGKVQRPDDPVNTGYVFDGWYTGTDGSGDKVIDSMSIPTGNTTYIANWLSPTNSLTVTAGKIEMFPGIGTEGWWLASDRSDYVMSWTGGTVDGPSAGSLVSISFTKYVPNHYELTTIECIRQKAFDYWGAVGNQKLMAFVSTSTGSCLSVESIYSGNAFTLTFLFDESKFGVPRVSSSQTTLTCAKSSSAFDLIYDEMDGFIRHAFMAKFPDRWGTYNNLGDCTGFKMSTWSRPGESIALPVNPSYVGYEFDGWFSATDGGEQIISSTASPDTTQTYYAHWSAKSVGYNVYHYKQNNNADGTPAATNNSTTPRGGYSLVATDSLSVAAGTTNIKPARKDATGELRGYSQPAEQTIAKIDRFGNTKIYYYYDLETYTISADPEPGNFAEGVTVPESYTVKTPEAINLPQPARAGYTFEGWIGTDLNSPTKAVTIDPATMTGDKAYAANTEASWQIITYNITYNLDGGNVAGGNPETYTVEDGEITLINPTRTGYNFAGWLGTDVDVASSEVKIPAHSIGNRSYTAVWEARSDIRYTVNEYLPNLGVDAADHETLSNFDLKQRTPQDGKADANKEVAPTSYAGFVSPSKITKKINADGSTVFDFFYTRCLTGMEVTSDEGITTSIVCTPEDSAKAGHNYEYDSSITVKAAVTPGYTFDGWDITGVEATTGGNADSGFTATFKVKTEAISVEAKGHINVQTIYLHDSIGETPDIKFNVNSEAIILPQPTKDGYEFCGWYTDETDFTGDAVVEIPAGTLGDVSLWPHWEAYCSSGYTYTNATTTMFPNGTTWGWWISSFNGFDGSLIWTTRTDGGDVSEPGMGSIVTLRFNRYTNRNPDMKEPEGLIAKSVRTGSDGWGEKRGDATKKLIGFRCPETGCYISVEDLYSGEPFTLRFVVTQKVSITESRIDIAGGENGTFEPVYEDVGNQAISTFNLGYAISNTDDSKQKDSNIQATYSNLGGSVVLPRKTPYRAGYSFVGWFRMDGETKIYANDASEVAVNGTDYTAEWRANESKIMFEENPAGDASYKGDRVDDKTGVTNQVINDSDRGMPNIARKGYTFGGWYSDTSFDDSKKIEQLPAAFPVGGVTYYAKWTRDTYTISLALNGGGENEYQAALKDTAGAWTLNGDYWTRTYQYDEAGAASVIALPATPASAGADGVMRTGYTLDGWAKQIEGGFSDDTITVVDPKSDSGDMLLQAKWTPVLGVDLPVDGGGFGTTNQVTFKVDKARGTIDELSTSLRSSSAVPTTLTASSAKVDGIDAFFKDLEPDSGEAAAMISKIGAKLATDGTAIIDGPDALAVLMGAATSTNAIKLKGAETLPTDSIDNGLKRLSIPGTLSLVSKNGGGNTLSDFEKLKIDTSKIKIDLSEETGTGLMKITWTVSLLDEEASPATDMPGVQG